MQYYLIQLSYTAEAWAQQIDKTIDAEQRLTAVKTLIAEFGGSLARYHFFEDEYAAKAGGEPHVLNGKFVGVGKDDLIAVLAMPDHEAALAFSAAVSAESGVRDIRLTPMTPMTDAIRAMQRASEVRRRTGYSAPGASATSWIGPKVRRGVKGKVPRRRRPASE